MTPGPARTTRPASGQYAVVVRQVNAEACDTRRETALSPAQPSQLTDAEPDVL
jgi:hypothetical protein